MRAIVLVGGDGTRLRPLTYTTPKPLLPIGDHAILELVIDQLRLCGFTRITLICLFQAVLKRLALPRAPSVT